MRNSESARVLKCAAYFKDATPSAIDQCIRVAICKTGRIPNWSSLIRMIRHSFERFCLELTKRWRALNLGSFEIETTLSLW